MVAFSDLIGRLVALTHQSQGQLEGLVYHKLDTPTVPSCNRQCVCVVTVLIFAYSIQKEFNLVLRPHGKRENGLSTR